MLRMSEIKRGDLVEPKHPHEPALFAGRHYKVVEVDYSRISRDYYAMIETEIPGKLHEINRRNFNRFNKV